MLTKSYAILAAATGGVTDEHGNIRLVASNYASNSSRAIDIDPSIDPLRLQTGLANAQEAEVGVVVKTHGDYVGGIVQLTELFDPYCDDPVIGWEGPRNDADRLCVEVQNVQFAAGKAGMQPLNHIYTEPPKPT
ncbi:expressed unknown protein [Seminavis robusta]|uniref:Uncharacterized protein n=1 Tax=Seminavis robusta TaxID=568900 RepID=A0A9N8H9P1_9STRA|nr:expressed unknown protein [Seminavis robusta]|eukprot:Sro213_g088560.1 n/a (134) ;mRNA; f:72273-72674